MLHATGHFRRREQLLDCRELHLPCRCVKSIAVCAWTGRLRLLRLAPLVNDFIALLSLWECQAKSSDASTLSAPAGSDVLVLSVPVCVSGSDGRGRNVNTLIHCTPNAGKDLARSALAVRVQHIGGNLGDVCAELTFTYRRGS